MASDYYVLDGHTVVPCNDVKAWARMFENKGNRIVKQESIGDVRVSTVFLGLDHRFGDKGPPLVFETMIFGGPHDDYQERCSTWDEAEAMHARAVELASQPLTRGVVEDSTVAPPHSAGSNKP